MGPLRDSQSDSVNSEQPIDRFTGKMLPTIETVYILTGISFFDTGFTKLYRSWGRLQGQKNVCAPKASVCGRKAGRFAAVLASPASSRALQVDCADTYPSSFALRDSVCRLWRRPISLPEAAKAQCCAASPRTGFASGVLPPASSSNTAHALPVVRPSSPNAAAGWSGTSRRCRLEEPVCATGCPGCRPKC